jgi:hypothetical protein
MILLISPSVGGVGFAEYVCAHPCLLTILQRRIPITFQRTLSRSLPYTQPCLCTRALPKASMVWYSEEAMEAFAIVVWSLAFVLFIVALALPCPFCNRNVKD